MRVSCITNNSLYSRSMNYSLKNRQSGILSTNHINKSEPSFKGSNVGKIIGGILGTAAVIVFAPEVAIMGLAGVGTLTGLFGGAVLDDKIDEAANKDNSDNQNKY